MRDVHLEPGAVLGEWRIEQQIGQGGIGTVYSAVHTEIGKRAALKVVRHRSGESLHAGERFLQEARIVNQIQHPNIVDIFQLGRLDDGSPYLVMELLHGESLGERIDRGRVAALDSIDILLQVCQALAAAHAQGVVHRDLKPDNIFLSNQIVKLLDWGIAKMTDPPPDMCEVTGAGTMVGTPRYIAPEQARGLDVDARTDVYSLGCIAHELFLEEPPFTADNVADLLVAHLTEPVLPPSDVWPDIPPVLERLILGMLEKEASNRPTLDDVIASLEQARFEMGGRSGGLALGSGPVVVPPSIRDSQRVAQPRASDSMRVAGTDPTLLAETAVDTRTRRFGIIAGGFAMAFGLVVFAAFSHDRAPTPVSPAEAATESTTPTPAVIQASVARAAAASAAVPTSPSKAQSTTTTTKQRVKRAAAKRATPPVRRIDPNATIDPFAR
ncbi:MAG TPA: serine/threonine-protein kinase [Kofleriaceae bacterium]|nr:serine/threonine-protein kinase [Kofleriaceae bacterium]